MSHLCLVGSYVGLDLQYVQTRTCARNCDPGTYTAMTERTKVVAMRRGMLHVPHKDEPAETDEEGRNNLNRYPEFRFVSSAIQPRKLFGGYVCQICAADAPDDASK